MYNNEHQNDLNKVSNCSNEGNNLIEFKRSIDSDQEDDNISSITNTFSSPNKMYPGGAKPLSSLFTTARTRIKEEGDEILEVADDEMNYDQIKLQPLHGNRCQIFYKNKSTIIN